MRASRGPPSWWTWPLRREPHGHRVDTWMELAGGGVARASLRGVEGHLCHVAPVHPGARQGAAGADATGEPLVERVVPRDGAGPDDDAHPLRQRWLRGGLRLPRQ